MKYKHWLLMTTLAVTAVAAQGVVSFATTNSESSIGQVRVQDVASYTTTGAMLVPEQVEVPREVLAAESYVEVPVYYNGKVANNIITFLEKTCNKGNSNEVYVGGYTAVTVKAYAYKTGSNVKVGAVVTYINKDGQTVSDWWDNIEQFYSMEEAENSIAWPTCENYSLNVEEGIAFVMPDQNENDLRIIFEVSGVKSSFSRATNQGVYLLEEAPEVDEDKDEEKPEVDEDKAEEKPEVDEDKEKPNGGLIFIGIPDYSDEP